MLMRRGDFSKDMSQELFEAINRGDVAKVTELLRYGVDPRAADRRDCSNSPLHTVANCRDPEVLSGMVNALLEAGADINARRSEDNRTPLQEAVVMRNVELVRLLLRRGVDFSARTQGTTAVERAAEYQKRFPENKQAYAQIEALLRQAAETALDFSLEGELLAAAKQPVPDDWRTLEGERAVLRFPRDWKKATVPNDTSSHDQVHPPTAHAVYVGRKPFVSPCLTIFRATGAQSHGIRSLLRAATKADGLLNEFLATRAKAFGGSGCYDTPGEYKLRQSVKIVLHGVRAVAIFHDFTLGQRGWLCLMVVFAKGNFIWYADGSGLNVDIAFIRKDLVRVLASMRIDPS